MPGANPLENEGAIFPAYRFQSHIWGLHQEGAGESRPAFPQRETLAKPIENFPKLQVSFCAPGTIPLLHTSNDIAEHSECGLFAGRDPANPGL